MDIEQFAGTDLVTSAAQLHRSTHNDNLAISWRLRLFRRIVEIQPQTMNRLNSSEWKATIIRNVMFGLQFIITCLVLLLVPFSCCPEYGVDYPPEGTLRYWDEHDTIVFYSPELDISERYPVCLRDYIGSVYHMGDRCNTEIQGYAAKYSIHKDSCENIENFLITITSNETITIWRFYSDGGGDNVRINTDDINSTSIELLGHSYEHAYLIPLYSAFDSLSAIYLTLEHGIIQYSFDSITFNLVNDEN